jgi:hypothetical protein
MMQNSGKSQEKESAVTKSALFSNKFALIGLVAMMLLGIGLIAGCGDSTLSGNGSAQFQYVASSPSGQIDLGSTAIVEARVVDATGVALSGQRVTFSVTPTALGYFTPASDTSAADGTVAAVFTSTSSGTATLQATVGGVTSTTTILINDNTSGSGRITVSVTPLQIIANSADSARVLITATKRDGTPIGDGTTIFLCAGERFQDRDRDGYFTKGVDSLIYDVNANDQWDPIGSIPASTTTSGGTSSVYYQTGNQATTVYIRATMIDGGDVSFAEVSAKLNPNTKVASITLSASFEDLRVKGVGGIEFGGLLATAYDEFGNPVPEGIPIAFTIASGPNGGENIQGKGYGPVEINTNSNGQASVTVYSGTISGTVRLRASSGTVVSAATPFAIHAGPPYTVRLAGVECNQASWEYVNIENKVTAIVCDIYTNPVPDSTAVYFWTSEGCIDGYSLTGVAALGGTHPGEASVKWWSCTHVNGKVWVHAETAGGTVTDSAMFLSTSPPVYVEIVDYPTALYAQGDEKGNITVMVYDVNHNLVIANTQVEFETKFGTIGNGGTVDGCHSSVFKTKYTAAQLKKDYSPVSPDDSIGAVSYVTVTAGGMGGVTSGFTTLFLTTGTYVKSSSIDIEPEVEPGTVTPFTVVIKDRGNNPLGGHRLTLFPNGGTITGSNYVTNEYGEVSLFYQAPGAEGQYLITVTDTDPRGAVSFAKKVKVKTAEL